MMPFVSIQDGCGLSNVPASIGQPCRHESGYIVEMWSMLTDELGANGVVATDWGMVLRGTLEPVFGPRTFTCLDNRACDAVMFDMPVIENWTPLASSGGIDPATGIPMPSNHSEYAYTVPVWSDSWTGIVLQTRRESSTIGALMPFSDSLWAVVAGFILVVALLLVLLAWLSGSDERPRRGPAVPAAVLHATYHALAACLGGEEYVWHHWASRLMRLGMLMVIIVLQATYTANLAAIFTQPIYVTHGPRSMDELSETTACVAVPEWAEYATPYVRSVLLPPAITPDGLPTEKADRQAWCHERLLDRTADVWLETMSAARP